MSPTRSEQINTHNFETLVESLKQVDDPRVENRSTYNLFEILAISVIAVLCGSESIRDIVLFAESKKSWLKKYLVLANGIASEDTFSRVLSLIDADSLNKVFVDWVSQVSKVGKSSISLDGKKVRGTHRGFNDGKSALTVVSAFSHQEGLCLLEEESGGSGGAEIGPALKCIELLDLKGVDVLMDAGIAKNKVIKKIHEKGGHYLSPIKRNNRNCLKKIEEEFTSYTGRISKSVEKKRGREDRRVARVLSSKRMDEKFQKKWPGVETLIEVVRERTIKDNSFMTKVTNDKGESVNQVNSNMGNLKTTVTTTYYVTSRKVDGKEALRLVRQHWGIENKLHWVLDVAFKEDNWTVRSKKLAKNLSLVRKIAFNIIKQSNTTGSVKGRMKRCGWDHTFLEKVLFLKK